MNISFSLVFYFVLFSFYLFIFLLLFLALWLIDFVDLLIRVYYLSTCPSIIGIFIWQWSDKSNWLLEHSTFHWFTEHSCKTWLACPRRIFIPFVLRSIPTIGSIPKRHDLLVLGGYSFHLFYGAFQLLGVFLKDMTCLS